MIDKPVGVFARDHEWAALTRFAVDAEPGATLGIVSGRRRQGKTLLLQELCAAAGGFYFVATEATATDSLRLLAHAIAEHGDLAAPPALTSWEDAVDVLLDLGVGSERGVPVVLDEFPYLCAASPELPSVVQKALAPLGRARARSKARLILCGSAITFMGRLLSGSAPLRGRAGLDLMVPTFDARTAARFWSVDDPDLAFRLHAVVGGTPAYRREYVRGDVPADLADFDDWVCRTVLDPSSPLHREARYLMAEGGDIRDPALYHSVLAAIADGNTTRGSIAKYIGRPADTLRHPITVLEDASLVVREADAVRGSRSTFRIDEPLINFYHAIMRPEWSRLQRPGSATEVWAESQARFTSRVLGPHFERLARWWTETHAAQATLGGRVSQVASGVVNDAANRASHEIDVVATDAAGRVVAIGEAKLGVTMGESHAQRLRRIRDLLVKAGRDAAGATLVCFSGSGFDAGLRDTARTDPSIVLVDLERIYTGS